MFDTIYIRFDHLPLRLSHLRQVVKHSNGSLDAQIIAGMNLPTKVGTVEPGQAKLASAIVDGVNNLNPGDPASVNVSFDGTNVHFTFGIPRGNDGNNGTNGTNGEVSNAALASAINGTSSNTNAVATLDTPFANDPPTLADMELMRTNFNTLVLGLRRP